MRAARVFFRTLRLSAAATTLCLLLLAAGTGRTWAQSDEPIVMADVVRAVVGVRARIPRDARTAGSLGMQREGNGVVIGADGLVLTIGYLILEASSAEITGPDGKYLPARVVGYDHNTGFGLLRATSPLAIKPVRIGESAKLAANETVLAISHGGPGTIVPARVRSRHPFAGYWEYLLEDAIFTTPPHPSYGGAALIGTDGRLVGIGSLFVNAAPSGAPPEPGNMFVPIDGLKPILADLLAHGRPAAPAHPWLGIHTEEAGGRVFILRLASGGPGEKAGLKTGDIIIGVGGKRIDGMADFFRKVWARGNAGAAIPLDILPLGSEDLTIRHMVVHSLDRYAWLKLNRDF